MALVPLPTYGEPRPQGQGNSMNRRIAGLLAALALAAAVPAAQATADTHGSQVVAAKKCGKGYKHAVMPDGSHKCLRKGQFCVRKKAWQRVYHQHGFHCKKNKHLDTY
jgi:hypothetical protein